MGDVSSIMPAVHPYGAGAIGTGHGMDYYIDDPERACVAPAKCLLIMADRLLSNDAALAKKVLAENKPRFASKEDYLKAIESLNMTKNAVVKKEDGTVVLDFLK